MPDQALPVPFSAARPRASCGTLESPFFRCRAHPNSWHTVSRAGKSARIDPYAPAGVKRGISSVRIHTRKLQAKSPTAAMADIAAKGLVMNCHARMSGTDFLILANGISFSMPQRAIM